MMFEYGDSKINGNIYDFNLMPITKNTHVRLLDLESAAHGMGAPKAGSNLCLTLCLTCV